MNAKEGTTLNFQNHADNELPFGKKIAAGTRTLPIQHISTLNAPLNAPFNAPSNNAPFIYPPTLYSALFLMHIHLTTGGKGGDGDDDDSDEEDGANHQSTIAGAPSNDGKTSSLKASMPPHSRMNDSGIPCLVAVVLSYPT